MTIPSGAPPPPGPPPPPPPPFLSVPPLNGSKAPGGGDARSALLQSIQKGTKLKKAVTNDKSGPALAGRVCDESSSKSAGSLRSNNSNNNAIGNDTLKLGGLFEGMSSMPKLKPVNGTKSPAVLTQCNQRNNSPPSVVTNHDSQMDFNTELTKHLTLKRQKHQPHINATEANLKTNRGPPPQPPTQLSKAIITSTSESICMSVLEKNKINLSNNNSSRISNQTASTITTKTFILNDNETVNKNNESNLSNKISSVNCGINGSKSNSSNNSGSTIRSKAANLNLTLGHNKFFMNSYNSNSNNNSNKNVNNNFMNHNNSNNNKNNKSNNNNATSTMNFQNINENTNSTNNNSTHISDSKTSQSTITTTTTPESTTKITTTAPNSLRNLTPNKSTLFSTNMGCSINSASSVCDGSGTDTIVSNDNSPESSTSSSPPTKSPKPVYNNKQQRKPNFAPKPPGLLAMANGQRPAVARHHSMKSPRSPPITCGPLFPMQQQFGTMRTPFTQSHEAINSGLRAAPQPPIDKNRRPTVKPPPPPTPVRSTSNSNLNLSNSAAPPVSACNTNLINAINSMTINTTQSTATTLTNSVTTLRDQFRDGSIGGSENANDNSSGLNVTPPPTSFANTSINHTTKKSNNCSPTNGSSKFLNNVLNGGIANAPPLPPHRTCPAPPPPQRQMSHTAVPPVPPQRHSSIRANAPVTPPIQHLPNIQPTLTSQTLGSASVSASTLATPSLSSSPLSYTMGSSNNCNINNSSNIGSSGNINTTIITSTATTITTTSTIGSASTSTNVVSRLVIDLETKYGKRFHNVTEFPKPPPFVNIPKVYPSRTVKATNAGSNNSNIIISITANVTAVNDNADNSIIINPSNNSSNSNANESTKSTVNYSNALTKAQLQPMANYNYSHALKKHRAPAPPLPPPQAGLAAATVSVIRQTSFLYGTACGIPSQSNQLQ